MDMGIQGFVEIILQAQLFGPAADVGIGRFGGFLHYIAQLSRKNQIALAFDGDRFCIQHFAACHGPGQTVDPSHGIGMFFRHGHEFHRAQVFFQGFRIKSRKAVILQHHLLAYLAAEGSNGPFQFPDARLSGIAFDDSADEEIRETDILCLETVSLHLAGNEVLFGNLHLFLFRVARELDELHAVKKGRWDGGYRIGGGQEEYLR